VEFPGVELIDAGRWQHQDDFRHAGSAHALPNVARPLPLGICRF
jgi:hypothetical protein